MANDYVKVYRPYPIGVKPNGPILETFDASIVRMDGSDSMSGPYVIRFNGGEEIYLSSVKWVLVNRDRYKMLERYYAWDKKFRYPSLFTRALRALSSLVNRGAPHDRR